MNTWTVCCQFSKYINFSPASEESAGDGFTVVSITVDGIDGGHSATYAPNTSPVPEPETYAMILAGLGLIAFTARRRKENAWTDALFLSCLVSLSLKHLKTSCLMMFQGEAAYIKLYY